MENARITKAVQQGQQGQWTAWDEALQRSVSWNDIWSMPPLRLSFVIRSLYDQLPSRDNLRKWGMIENSRCVLCEVQTLRHVLSSCKYALEQGRCTWRHNQVLQILVEAKVQRQTLASLSHRGGCIFCENVHLSMPGINAKPQEKIS